ncbi:hypothetical protein F4780DRAFT_783639 [Xylariomycetidae sp. FL0641]|nr:hypothetical protein F4780DRAFT_783639 [Xylariomycetidae sp. FL0641]
MSDSAEEGKKPAAEGAGDTSQSSARRFALDRSLAPIRTIYQATADMVHKAAAVKDNKGQLLLLPSEDRKIRIGTMCSGTEAPLFALELLKEATENGNLGQTFPRVEHVMSVEIEPFKQAYLARNTNGTTIFQDVRDFVGDAEKARTALGGLADIPRELDLLVAGTSCVDFSTLNPGKIRTFGVGLRDEVKTLCHGNPDQNPENFRAKSGAILGKLKTQLNDPDFQKYESLVTFFSMLLYTEKHRPKVVILENVEGAPWKEMVENWFPLIRYTAASAKLDTKRYYIPQTRSRGYLLAIDNDHFGTKQAVDVTVQWPKTLVQLERPSSSPISDWLLPSTHPLIIRARQEDAQKTLVARHGQSKWDRSKIRHDRVRRDERIPHSHPLTLWSNPGSGKPTDRMDALTIKALGDRACDYLEIANHRATIRGVFIAKPEGSEPRRVTFDPLFKTLVYDLSQNVDRGDRLPPIGMTGCLTPKGMPFLSEQCRLVSGVETMSLQGLPVDRQDLTRETQDQLRDLAGNAMSVPVVGAAMMSLFLGLGAAGWEKFGKHVKAKAEQRLARAPAIDWPLGELSADYTDLTNQATSHRLNDLLELARRCRRYCYCNGQAKQEPSEFVQCQVCHTIRCKRCAGNPAHEFVSVKIPDDLIPSESVQVSIMRLLPGVVTDIFPRSPQRSHQRNTRTLIDGDFPILTCLWDATFYFEAVLVTEVISVAYRATSGGCAFELRAVIDDTTVTWYLYLEPWCDAATATWKRLDISPADLKHPHDQDRPFARATIADINGSPLPDHRSWEVWSYTQSVVPLIIKNNASLLSVMKPSGGNQPELSAQARQMYAQVEGDYRPKPNCGVAEKSLYVCEPKRIFLFKDPAPVTPYDRDRFVFAGNCRRLEHHEHPREVLLRLPFAWTPPGKSDDNVDHVEAILEGQWLEVRASSQSVKRDSRIPPAQCTLINDEGLKLYHHQTVQLASMRFYRAGTDDEFGIVKKIQHGGNEYVLTRHDQTALNPFIAPFQVKVAGLLGVGTRMRIDLGNLTADNHCQMCTPQLYAQMTDFEDAMKRRELPFEMRVSAAQADGWNNSLKQISVQYVLRPSVLAHQALAHLPHGSAAYALSQFQGSQQCIFEIQELDKYPVLTNLTPFRLSIRAPPGGSTEPEQPTGLRPGTTLTDHQAKTFRLMMARERQGMAFNEREQEELVMHSLNLRLVGTAERFISRYGGVIADDVGSGKTVVTLALIGNQQSFDQDRSKEIRAQSFPTAVNLAATLVVVPNHLVGQWTDEAIRFLNIDRDRVVAISGIKDLRGSNKLAANLLKAVVVIVGTSVMNALEYHEALAAYSGAPRPARLQGGTSKPRLIAGRAFEDWYVDAVGHLRAKSDPQQVSDSHRRDFDRASEDKLSRGLRRASESEPLDSPYSFPKVDESQIKVPAAHLLESYTFARVVYDEFSYEDGRAELFVRQAQCYSTWILSGTPPTRNLGAVCTIASLLGIHIARPLEPRPGLPRITHGPKVQRQTAVEVQHSYAKFDSDVLFAERHQQGERFLRDFSAATVLHDVQDRAFGISEQVITCRLQPGEQLLYQDVQGQLQRLAFDANELPVDVRGSLPPTIKWHRSGRLVANEILILAASTQSYEKGRIDNIIPRRRKLMEQTKVNLAKLTQKTMWLMDHYGRAPADAKSDACDQAVEDLQCFFEKVYTRDYAGFKGQQTWKTVSDAVLGTTFWRTAEAEKMSWDTFVKRKGKQESDHSLYEFFTFGRFVSDRLCGPKASAQDADEARRLLNEIGGPIRDEMNGLGHDLQDRLRKINATTEQKLDRITGSSEIKAKLAEEDPDFTELVTELPMAMACLDFAKELMSAEETRPEGNDGTGDSREDFQGTKEELTNMARHHGIKTKASDSKAKLQQWLRLHSANQLPAEMYTEAKGCDFQKTVYPVGERTSRRGRSYTPVQNEILEVQLHLQNWTDLLVDQARQLKVAETLRKPRDQLRCDACDQPAVQPILVGECGHLLCAAHLAKDGVAQCHDLHFENAKTRDCPGWLKNHVELEKLEYRPAHSLTSKANEITDTIQMVPEGDHVLLFYQFTQEREDLVKALKTKQITFSTYEDYVGGYLTYAPKSHTVGVHLGLRGGGSATDSADESDPGPGPGDSLPAWTQALAAEGERSFAEGTRLLQQTADFYRDHSRRRNLAQEHGREAIPRMRRELARFEAARLAGLPPAPPRPVAPPHPVAPPALGPPAPEQPASPNRRVPSPPTIRPPHAPEPSEGEPAKPGKTRTPLPTSRPSRAPEQPEGEPAKPGKTRTPLPTSRPSRAPEQSEGEPAKSGKKRAPESGERTSPPPKRICLRRPPKNAAGAYKGQDESGRWVAKRDGREVHPFLHNPSRRAREELESCLKYHREEIHPKSTQKGLGRQLQAFQSNYWDPYGRMKPQTNATSMSRKELRKLAHTYGMEEEGSRNDLLGRFQKFQSRAEKGIYDPLFEWEDEEPESAQMDLDAPEATPDSAAVAAPESQQLEAIRRVQQTRGGAARTSDRGNLADAPRTGTRTPNYGPRSERPGQTPASPGTLTLDPPQRPSLPSENPAGRSTETLGYLQRLINLSPPPPPQRPRETPAGPSALTLDPPQRLERRGETPAGPSASTPNSPPRIRVPRRAHAGPSTEVPNAGPGLELPRQPPATRRTSGNPKPASRGKRSRPHTKTEDEKKTALSETPNGQPKVLLLQMGSKEAAGQNLQYANHVMFASTLTAELQEEYEAQMKQARGRAVRYGQQKTVNVYHFVAAQTFDVDLWEQRHNKDIVQKNGQVQLVTRDPSSSDAPREDRVNSSLGANDLVKLMSEQDWLSSMGMKW